MIYFFIFILILSICEIDYVMKNIKEKKGTIMVIYFSMVIVVLIIGLYYYLNKYGYSVSQYIFKLLNIKY
jgi:hypothetical protein